MGRLDGKVAVITGGNSGVGAATAKLFAKEGATVVITARREAALKEVADEITAAGGEVYAVSTDISKPEDPEALMQKVMDKYGKIDILVNNAGTIRRAPLLEYKEEDWDAVMNINLNAVYHLSQKVAKVMVEQKSGKIINVASMLSFQGGKFVPPYTASKHGVAGITKAFANELATHNVQINAIAPGYIKTANTAPIRADEKRNSEILSRIPADRWGEVSDLMGTVVFLASRASDYINGHILAVDGGWLVR